MKKHDVDNVALDLIRQGPKKEATRLTTYSQEEADAQLIAEIRERDRTPHSAPSDDLALPLLPITKVR